MRLSLTLTVIPLTTAAIGLVTLLGSAVIAAQDATVRAGTPGVSHPRIVEAGPPVYPPIAQSARVTGNVIIEAVIDATGRVDGAAVTRSIPLLNAAAIDAVQKWQFEAPRANGRAIRFSTTVTLHFQLFDALFPVPPPGVKASGSGMPGDFAVVYERNCRTVVTLSTATHDLEPVYRVLSSTGLIARTEGLVVSDDPAAPTATVSNTGVEMTISGKSPEVDQPGRSNTPVCSLQVRSDGKRRQLWPPSNPSLLPPDYTAQLRPALALLQRMVEP
jgi:TonB family protein